MVNKFAKNSDIKMIVEEKQISTSQFKRLLAKKGIFSLVKNSEELSNQTYQIFFGSSDIEYIQDVMQTSGSYQKSSLVILEPIDEYDSLDEFIDVINEDIQQYRNIESKYKIENIHKDLAGNLHVSMSYSKKIKGKAELIKNKIKEIDIKITKMQKENKLVLDIRQNDNADLKELDLFISEINNIDKDNKLFKPEYLTLDKLTASNKIKFFDDLIKNKYKEWKLDDIKGVDVRKNEDIDCLVEDDENDHVISSDELAGIKTAIFKGNSIRDTGIVKKFENQGFYFTSMKFKYSFNKTVESFVIDINFKGTDNIKIDIVKTFEKDEQDKDLIMVLPKVEQEKIIAEFQGTAYKIYSKLIESQRKKVFA